MDIIIWAEKNVVAMIMHTVMTTDTTTITIITTTTVIHTDIITMNKTKQRRRSMMTR